MALLTREVTPIQERIIQHNFDREGPFFLGRDLHAMLDCVCAPDRMVAMNNYSDHRLAPGAALSLQFDGKLREEFFGGILFDSTEHRHYMLDSVAYEMLRSLSGGPATSQELLGETKSVAGLDQATATLSALAQQGIVGDAAVAGTVQHFPARDLSLAYLQSPIIVEVEVTYGCFRACRHCAYESSPEARMPGELSAEQWGIIFEKLADAVGLSVYIRSDTAALNEQNIIRRDFRNTQTETEFFTSYLPPDGRVLDLGCGTGTNLRALAELGYSCIGVDQSQQFIDYAKNASEKGAIDFMNARAADCETDQQFDLIYTIFVTLNYMDRADLPILFRKVRRWLRPGGHFVVDIGHMLNFVDSYQPYIIAHHQHEGILITRLIRHLVNAHTANWRHEETILVRERDGKVSMYDNFFDQMVLTGPELCHLLADAGLQVVEEFGSFRKEPPSRRGQGHLIFVASWPAAVGHKP